MQLRFLLFAFGAFAIAHAIPVPKMSSAERDEIRQLDVASKSNAEQAVRNGRQGGGFYDYFAYNPYPSPYQSDYNQPSYYPDYYGSYFDSMAYQPPPPPQQPIINSSPVGYPSRRKYNKRRKNFEATTQRWTVWDLARK